MQSTQKFKERFIADCRLLLTAYRNGALGNTTMPEDENPGFGVFGSDQADSTAQEKRIAYFTLPMSLNYQRDSYKLWQAAKKAYNDPATVDIFDCKAVAAMPVEQLREKLLKYKVALQPNKHIQTWQTIATTVAKEFGSFQNLIAASGNDFLKLKELITINHKKGFPYLSGPKIFNYWSFILMQYCGIALTNAQFIDIAPDTHITQCSVKLGLLTADEAQTLSKEEINARWREILMDSDILPIKMHPPLWFWSHNGFIYELPK